MFLSLCCAVMLGQPNILVVVWDDIGVDRLPQYGLSADVPATPHLDAFLSGASWFPTALARPSCSPTRASMMTGRYPEKHGVGEALTGNVDFALPASELTLAEVFASSGYSTCLVGKYHLGNQTLLGGDPFHPIGAGFQCAGFTPGNPGDYFDWERISVTNTGVYVEETLNTYITTQVTDDAVVSLQTLPEPWFLWVGYHAAHKPFHVPPLHLHSRGNQTTALGQFLAMVEALDTETGRLLGAIPDNTVVVLVTDNGTPAQVSDLPSAKGSIRNGGTRVLMAFAGPGVDPGVGAGLATVDDVFPTVLDLAGVACPAVHLDGVSLVPAFSGTPARTEAYTSKFRLGGVDHQQRVVHEDEYSLLRFVDDAKERMYVLPVDPWELTSICTFCPQEPCCGVPFDLQPTYRQMREVIEANQLE